MCLSSLIKDLGMVLTFQPVSIGKNIRVEVIFFKQKILYPGFLKHLSKIENTHEQIHQNKAHFDYFQMFLKDKVPCAILYSCRVGFCVSHI